MLLATRIERLARRQSGFTLLELLVAMAIFAIASVMAYGGLHAVSTTKASLDQEIRFWRELGQVFGRMDTDFVQITPQMFQIDETQRLPPLNGGSSEYSGFFIELTRYDVNRSPIRVGYQCDKGQLRLRLEPANKARLDRSGDADAPPIHALLGDIEQCNAAFLGHDNIWYAAWPGEQTRVKPRAIRVRLTLSQRGTFERVFFLP